MRTAFTLLVGCQLTNMQERTVVLQRATNSLEIDYSVSLDFDQKKTNRKWL